MGTLAELYDLKLRRQIKLSELKRIEKLDDLCNQEIPNIQKIAQQMDAFSEEVNKSVKSYNEGDYVWQGYHYYKMKKFRANCKSYLLVIEHMKDYIEYKEKDCYVKKQELQGDINKLTTQIDNFVLEE